MLRQTLARIIVSPSDLSSDRFLGRLGLAVLLIGLTAALAVPVTAAQTIVDEDGQVAKSGPDIDCDGTGTNAVTTVEAAVESGAGEVVVCGGTYGSKTEENADEDIEITGNIEIKPVAGSGEVTVRSYSALGDSKQDEAIKIHEAGSEITKIEIKGLTIEHDGSGSSTTISVETGVEGTSLKNLTMTRGSLSSTSAAISFGDKDVEVKGCDITGGVVGHGGSPDGIYTIENTTVRGAGGQEIWLTDADELIMRGNTIETTGAGGGVDELGVALYNVETKLVFENNTINASVSPLLLGTGITVETGGEVFAPLNSATDMRTLLSNNTINGGASGKFTFVARSDGTLRMEDGNVSDNNSKVYVVRAGITSKTSAGKSSAYEQSAIGSARSGDVVHLANGTSYDESVTLTKNLGFETPGTASISSLAIDGSYVVDATGTLTFTKALTTGAGSELTGDPLVLGAGAALTDNGLASGTLKATRTVSSGETVDFGNIGLTLSTAEGSTAPEKTTVIRTDGEPVAVGDGSISRFYKASATTSTGLDLDVEVEYDDGNNGGDDELTTTSVSDDGALGVFRSTDNGETWSESSNPDQDLNNNVFTVSGLSQLSQFTLAEAGGALPVELASFTGAAKGKAAVLTWTTASETNNAGFRVQRKTSTGFETLSFVGGKGTTTKSTTYRHRISDLEYGTHTFRLQQVDQDGSTSLSEKVQVEINLEDSFEISKISPNPISRHGQVEVAVRETQDVTLGIYDPLGRRVASVHDGPLRGGRIHRFSIEARFLAPGLYFLRATGTDFQATRRFVVVR